LRLDDLCVDRLIQNDIPGKCFIAMQNPYTIKPFGEFGAVDGERIMGIHMVLRKYYPPGRIGDFDFYISCLHRIKFYAQYSFGWVGVNLERFVAIIGYALHSYAA
jgi:hypothetical protein